MIETTTGAQDSQLTRFFCEQIVDIDAADFLDWIRDNFEPGDIFESVYLETWALENGFVKEE